MYKIKRRYLPVIISVTMGFFMGLIMSFVMTLIYVGLTPVFFMAWIKSAVLSIAVGIPVALLVGPLVIRVLQDITVDE